MFEPLLQHVFTVYLFLAQMYIFAKGLSASDGQQAEIFTNFLWTLLAAFLC